MIGKVEITSQNKNNLPKQKKPNARATLETDIVTRQKIRVLASLEAMTMQEWLTWMVSAAYQSQVASRSRVAKTR
jgi:hypothetical protein